MQFNAAAFLCVLPRKLRSRKSNKEKKPEKARDRAEYDLWFCVCSERKREKVECESSVRQRLVVVDNSKVSH